MDHSKRDIAWVVAGELDRDQTYTGAAIDRLIRQTIRAEFLSQPYLAPDHVRMAMVEAGYVTRDSTGDAYRVSEDFVGPIEEEERERALLKTVREMSVDAGVVVCPACGDRLGATSLVGHCQRAHNWSTRWPRLVEKYCR